MKQSIKISVIGLGYVGLPLAVEFSKFFNTIGFDIDKRRVNKLNSGFDSTKEVESKELIKVLNKNQENYLKISNKIEDILDSNYYIITVPTPIDKINKPNLGPLLSASESIGKILKKGDTVIYESTVYPGATEEECVPILEKYSKLRYIEDFNVGYSPERINPGDKERKLINIMKITSGSCESSAKSIDNLYNKIIKAGTYLAPSIKVAEAAKVIENSQRDINIAFVNELSKIFNLMDIDTNEVLKAASTKWNFLDFKPGLVGGHCIGVDPYYLAQKSIQLGYNPEIILSGRRLNDSMGIYVANEFLKIMSKKDINIKNSNVLILGLTFKENCPDTRNTRVIDILNHLKEFGVNVSVYDNHADYNEVKRTLGIKLITEIEKKYYDGIIIAVNHDEFKQIDYNSLKKNNTVIYDVKGVLGKLADRCL